MEGIEQTSESQNATSTQPNHKPRTRGAEGTCTAAHVRILALD